VPGVDFAGTVEASEDSRYKPGDRVVLTGWRVGEVWWGGYAQKARVKADWLVPLPDGLSTKQAMAVGTAGFTAMLAVMALEDHGLTAGEGEVLVTGAAGGVGSVATAILAHGGYQVAGVTGRPETADYLKSLGAETIVAREELNEPSKRPLESERWSGCIDAVGGVMLSRVLAQMRGLAGGAKLETTVIPFLLRGVNLLGIDSVMRAYEDRIKAWGRIRPSHGTARKHDPTRHAFRSARFGSRDPQGPGQGPCGGGLECLAECAGRILKVSRT
jgi:acrylyl-CoA reductase (NADPH)